MSLLFYYIPRSTASVTGFVLDELEHGLAEPLAKRVELSLQAGDTRTPHYLSTVNPNGLVPAIVHDGISIWESAAITMYLGETFGVEHEKQPLYPGPGPRRGEAMKWIVWANTTLAPVAVRLSAAKQRSPDSAPENDTAGAGEAEGEEQKARKDMARYLDILNGALQDKDFLIGREYSLADTHLWCLLAWVGMMAVSFDGHANVKGWMARVGDRPALKRG